MQYFVVFGVNKGKGNFGDTGVIIGTSNLVQGGHAYNTANGKFTVPLYIPLDWPLSSGNCSLNALIFGTVGSLAISLLPLSLTGSSFEGWCFELRNHTMVRSAVDGQAEHQ